MSDCDEESCETGAVLPSSVWAAAATAAAWRREAGKGGCGGRGRVVTSPSIVICELRAPRFSQGRVASVCWGGVNQGGRGI